MCKYYLTASFVLFALATYSQQPRYKKDQIIEFDLLNSAGPFPANFYIKEDVRIRYRIKNISRNVYTVAVNSESKPLFAEKPPIFGIISDIDLSKLQQTPAVDKDGLAVDELKVLKPIFTESEQKIIDAYETAKDEVVRAIDNFNRNDIKLKKLAALYRNLNAKLVDGATDFDVLLAQKHAETFAILSADFAYTGNATDDGAMLSKLRITVEDLFSSQTVEYTKLVQHHAMLKRLFGLFEVMINAKIKGLNSKSDKKKIEQLELALANEKILVAGLDEVVNDIKLNYSKVNEYNQAGFSQALCLVYQRITKANWEYISPSIVGENDEISVKVSIEPKDGTIPTANYAMFNGTVKGGVYGFKLNFSTGVFGIIGKKLVDKTYRVDTIAGDAFNNIIVENGTRQSIQPAVGALMHFYMKRPGVFSWGGNFGFSISDETRLNYHLGFSFLFGERQRIIFNFGLTACRVKELSSEYEIGQRISKSSGLTTIPTDNFYKAGGFAALTFNVSK